VGGAGGSGINSGLYVFGFDLEDFPGKIGNNSSAATG